jgi:hypothetical protein
VIPRREFARIEMLELPVEDTPPRQLIPGNGTPYAELIRQVIAIEQRAWEPSTSEK